jgi:cyclopropane fatty-acyl-phospholipid synthase-like methyltransferase
VYTGIKYLDSISDKRVLDIGSGRGGGLAFLAKYYQPELAVGIDFSAHQIQFSKTRHEDIDNLYYSWVNILLIMLIRHIIG